MYVYMYIYIYIYKYVCIISCLASQPPSLLMLATNRAQGMTCPSGRGDQRAKDISDDGRVCVSFFF